LGIGIYVFREHYIDLLQFAIDSDEMTYIPVIPLIGLYLIFTHRDRIAIKDTLSIYIGGTLAVSGLILFACTSLLNIEQDSTAYLSVTTVPLLIWIWGILTMSTGVRMVREKPFVYLFWLFIIPIPDPFLQFVIQHLRRPSASFTDIIFRISGITYVREGFDFHLPQLSVSVADECSGIRSSLALLITSLLMGHLFIRTAWKKCVLIGMVFPITVFKNGLRISFLTFGGAFIDNRILDSTLHRQGGIPFFILALVLLGGVLWLLTSAPFFNQERRKMP
jgi:exosortase